MLAGSATERGEERSPLVADALDGPAPEIKIDGEEFLIMREDEILGILERAGAASGGKKGK